MIEPSLETIVVAGASLAIALLVVCGLHLRQGRKMRQQLSLLDRAQQDLSSLNSTNIGLGHRIKSMEGGKGFTPQATAFRVQEPTEAMAPLNSAAVQDLVASDDGPAQFELGRDLDSLQARQETLLASLDALEQNRGPRPDAGQAPAQAQPEYREPQFSQSELSQSELSQAEPLQPEFSQQAFSQPEPSQQELSQQQLSQQEFREPRFSESGFSQQAEAPAPLAAVPASYDDEPEPDMEQTPYTRASALLDQGISPEEIERLSGLSKAEVALMATMHKNMSKFAVI